jgi:hypothetical protein
LFGSVPEAIVNTFESARPWEANEVVPSESDSGRTPAVTETKSDDAAVTLQSVPFDEQPGSIRNVLKDERIGCVAIALSNYRDLIVSEGSPCNCGACRDTLMPAAVAKYVGPADALMILLVIEVL